MNVIDQIRKHVKLVNFDTSVYAFVSVITTFYDKANSALKQELRCNKGEDFHAVNTESSVKFQLIIRDAWKRRIDTCLGEVLSNNVVSPVMKKLGNAGIGAAGRRLRSYIEHSKMKVCISVTDFSAIQASPTQMILECVVLD
jgi:hypothetical protein